MPFLKLLCSRRDVFKTPLVPLLPLSFMVPDIGTTKGYRLYRGWIRSLFFIRNEKQTREENLLIFPFFNYIIIP